MWSSTIRSNAHTSVPNFDRRRKAAWIANRDLRTKCSRESIHGFEIRTMKSWETKNWRNLGSDLKKKTVFKFTWDWRSDGRWGLEVGDLMESEGWCAMGARGLRSEIWWRVRVDVWWELEGWSTFENKRASLTFCYAIYTNPKAAFFTCGYRLNL